MPLRRTYASASLAFDNLSEPTQNVHHSTAHPSSVSPTPTVLVRPIIKLPATSSRCRLLLPLQSSPLGPRQALLRHSSHPERQIFPPFNPGRGLYRKILKQQFLRATKKATMEGLACLATNDLTTITTTDDQWPLPA